MFSRRTLLNTAIVCTLAALGCGEAADPATLVGISTPNFAVVGESEWRDVDFSTLDQCNGERVDFSTRRRVVNTVTFDGSGGGHFGSHRAWEGTGVGRTTGNEYILNWPLQLQQSFAALPFTFTRRIANNLVTKGSDDNRIFSVTAHFTIIDGETISEVREVAMNCAG